MSRFNDEFHPEETNIALCGSMMHKELWAPIIDELREMGYSVSTPDFSETRDWTGLSNARLMHEKVSWYVVTLQISKRQASF